MKYATLIVYKLKFEWAYIEPREVEELYPWLEYLSRNWVIVNDNLVFRKNEYKIVIHPMSYEAIFLDWVTQKGGKYSFNYWETMMEESILPVNIIPWHRKDNYLCWCDVIWEFAYEYWYRLVETNEYMHRYELITN
jgi:hypothetical protein